ncbi:MAG: UbiD family decarboxylase [Deltaproteobacteria bacterium]|nr:UbiD family decarboxylase [Deltaproteobacteria bacterium]
MSLDLREWVAAVEERGELRRLAGADWDLEIGVLTELSAECKGPALLFDEIWGYPKGYRVLSNALVSDRRFAFTFGVDEVASPLELVRQIKDKLRVLTPLELIEATDGPVLENLAEGEDIDLFRFPAPKWHERDGGRYIGTGDVVIVRDPETGCINAAPYRVQVHGKNLAGLYMAPGNQGSAICRKYWSRGEACPMIVVAGQHPLIWASGSMKWPAGVSELEIAGALAGEPLTVIRSSLTGLPFPAEAEIVLEGECPPIDRRSHPEAPFGEFTGYYTWSDERGPVIEVRRAMWRNDPIILGAPPLCPPAGERLRDYLQTAQLWKRLEEREMPGLKSVWILPAGVSGLLTVIAVDQQYEGHGKDVAAAAISVGGLGRFIIVVDSDIDPTNEQEVLWAVATRCDPLDAVEIVRNCRSTILDPLIPPEKKNLAGQPNSARAVLLACRPFSWRSRFPVVNRFSDEIRRAVGRKWADQF